MWYFPSNVPFLLPIKIIFKSLLQRVALPLTCGLFSKLFLTLLGRLLCSSNEFGHMLFVKQVTCLKIEQKDDLAVWTLKRGLDSHPGSEVACSPSSSNNPFPAWSHSYDSCSCSPHFVPSCVFPCCSVAVSLRVLGQLWSFIVKQKWSWGVVALLPKKMSCNMVPVLIKEEICPSWEKQTLTRLPIHSGVFPWAGKTKLKLEEMAGDSSLASTDWRPGLGSLRLLGKGQLERNHPRARSPADFSLLSNLDAAGWESPEQARRTMGTGGVWRRVWGAVCGNQLGFFGLSAEVLRALCAQERRCSW